MRPDRFITLNLVQPLRRRLARIGILGTRPSAYNPALPILMYHSISDDPETGVRPYYRICTRPERFREQMQWLKNNGYCGVTLNDGLTWLDSANRRSKVEHGGQTTQIGNSQPVVLTFDDGFRDFFTAAWPILQEFGFTSTMYLPTAFIGNTRRLFSPSPRRGEGRGEVNPSTLNPLSSSGLCRSTPSPRRGEGRGEVPPSPVLHPPSSGNGRECLTWDEVREMKAAGIEFGSHTVNHTKLVECAWPEIESELRASKSEIEDRLGVSCPAFAYPYAFPQGNQAFAPRFRDLVASVGYRNCVTTEIGRVKAGDNPYGLKRLIVNSLDDTALFAAKLAGSYDWLAPLQSGLKRIKSVIPRKPTPNHTVHHIEPLPAIK
jgi:peptidoglycan/xylan/chitin deacetylase (PgdA/CDA1 family)